ncbi:hypothetical protein Taro_040963 [Colocasia esculenta]|uniref:Secoisolariciresinol dehydrogenase n=1 Tax=Colocasia esculenta TaxID=4460 RepID=A0A843WNE0_COLES|nr:hypothetical protein [Colocasia esculenta]
MGSSPVLSVIARRLEGKVALITGGASGIGERTARVFCEHGAKAVIADVQDDRGQAICKDIGSSAASFVHCDVTSEADVERAVGTAVNAHGRLDVMFNNAGVAVGYNPVFATEKPDFERVLSVNVIGPFLGTKHAARAMIPARRGSIVNAASVASLCSYTASKHAVVGLTRNAAVELGQFGVRVNCVSPHALATPLASGAFKMDDGDLEDAVARNAVLAGATLKPQDIAEAVLFLASDEAKYMNGHNLVVDGGFTIINPSLGCHKCST